MWCASRGACGAYLAPRRAALARRSAGGARAPCRSRGSACAPRALFGIGQKSGASSGQTLADIEAEIDAAAPASSTAATAQLSLADAVWKVSKETPMSLRDRAACAIAAEAVQALCETGLERASLVVTLALAEALRRNGFESEGVRTVAGYLVGDDDEAVAHCWLEVDGARPRQTSAHTTLARAEFLTPRLVPRPTPKLYTLPPNPTPSPPHQPHATRPILVRSGAGRGDGRHGAVRGAASRAGGLFRRGGGARAIRRRRDRARRPQTGSPPTSSCSGFPSPWVELEREPSNRRSRFAIRQSTWPARRRGEDASRAVRNGVAVRAGRGRARGGDAAGRGGGVSTHRGDDARDGGGRARAGAETRGCLAAFLECHRRRE